MSRWRKVPLGEAIELAYGKSLPKGMRVVDGKVPVYGSNGITDWHDVALVNESTVIVGRKGSAGAVQYVEVPCYPIDTTYFVRVRTGFEFDIKFLYYLLRQLDLSRLKTATGVPGLTREDAYRELIPVPPLAEQHRIVDILSRAEGIVRLRHEAQKKAAEIIPALFVDMFGDPTINPKGWQKYHLKHIGKVITGSTPPTSVEGMFGSDVPFITPGDLEVNTLSTKRYLTALGAGKSRLIRAGATMVCCIGATIGKTDRTWVFSAFNQQINGVDWDKRIVEDDYGFVCMRFHAREVAAKGSATALPILKKSLFEKISIPVPPIGEQISFGRKMESIRSIQSQQSAATQKAEATFKSLLAHIFSGQEL